MTGTVNKLWQNHNSKFSYIYFFIKFYNFFYSISLIKEKEEPIVKKFVGQGKRDITKSEL